MIGFIAFGAIALSLHSGYLVSLYSLAVYIDPDEVRTLAPGATGRRRQLLAKLAGDPRAFVHLATIYRTLAVIVITASTIILTNEIIDGTILKPQLLYPITLFAVWLICMISFELLPRWSSRRAINRSMIRYLWLIGAMYILFAPIVKLYRSALVRTRKEHRVTEEEKEEIVERAIETLADQAGIDETIIEQDEKEMIGQIFLLDQTLVREIMSPRIDIVGIEKKSSFADIQELVRSRGYSRYPVYQESIDKAIGVLYVKDLFSNMPAAGEEFVIAKYLRRPYYVPETKVIGELLREFKSRQLHIAIVVDEYGGVAGLVTFEDILEEIVGEIQDEHDVEEADWIALKDGRYQVDAGLSVEKLLDHLGLDHDQIEYETVGGLIYDLVGSVPDRGTKVTWNNVELEVVGVEGQRIKQVIVRFTG